MPQLHRLQFGGSTDAAIVFTMTIVLSRHRLIGKFSVLPSSWLTTRQKTLMKGENCLCSSESESDATLGWNIKHCLLPAGTEAAVQRKMPCGVSLKLMARLFLPPGLLVFHTLWPLSYSGFKMCSATLQHSTFFSTHIQIWFAFCGLCWVKVNSSIGNSVSVLINDLLHQWLDFIH